MIRSSACVMCVALLSASLRGAASGEPNLDIAGIKIGMGMKEAMKALKTDNPKLTVAIDTHNLTGFDKPVQPSVFASQNASPDNDGERIEVLFTMPPNRETVWGVSRTYNYIPRNQPSLENTLAALRSKYGPESIPADTDPRNRTKNMVWVYDASGKLLPRDQAMPLYMSCGGKLQSHFGNGDIASFNDISRGAAAAKSDCDSIVLITASVQAGSITPGSSELAVNNLIVQMNDGRIYGKAIQATIAVTTGTARANENKAAAEVNKRGGPKL